MKSEDIYRKVFIRMWGDSKFKKLSPLPPSGQSLWIYLLTGPFSNRLGLFKAGEMAVSEELGWDLKDFRKAFQEAFHEGLIQDSPNDRVIYIPNFVRLNFPASVNVVISWSAEWKEVPECPLKLQAWNDIKALMDKAGKAWVESFIKSCPKPFIKPFGKPSPKTMRIQEQEQEQEKEKDSCPKSKILGASLPKGFPEFWMAYPRKVQKQAAIKAWKKLNPPLEACLTALEWQKKLPDWIKDGGQFIPYPASWLNAGQWEDEKPINPLAGKDSVPSHPYRASCMCGDCMRYEIERDKRIQERNNPGGSR